MRNGNGCGDERERIAKSKEYQMRSNGLDMMKYLWVYILEISLSLYRIGV